MIGGAVTQSHVSVNSFGDPIVRFGPQSLRLNIYWRGIEVCMRGSRLRTKALACPVYLSQHYFAAIKASCISLFGRPSIPAIYTPHPSRTS